MTPLLDQAERDRFVLEHGKNISVIAPAGVGKTRSIVDRIVNLARLPETQAVEKLSRLVVVTYSVRAAQEMQQRARVAIRNARVSAAVQRAFQRTFFGTIHSYCVRLLDRFGHYLGLPSAVTLLQGDDELWNRFLVHGLGRQDTSHERFRDLFHFYAPAKLYALGREIPPGDEPALRPFPHIQIQPILNYGNPTLHAATRKTIVKAQDAARIWSEAWARGERFRPLPKCPTSEKAAAFAEIWSTAFAPLHEWLRDAALAFGRHLANAYEAFRLAEAVMTYDDQVRLASRALSHPAVRRELAEDRLSVLLDEAQDTDPTQFEVLLRVAGLGDNPNQAADQSFSIVGDFQQSIYAPRSDLAVHRRVHGEVSAAPRGTSSKLTVTFRCDQAIIDFVNRFFSTVLDNVGGQCDFVRLSARDQAGPGQVVRWICPDPPPLPAGEKMNAEQRARHEAVFLARRIGELGPAGLGASTWSQVAILCPRKNWLLDIQRELLALNLPVQLHSSNERQLDRTPGAWLAALVWVAAHPEDSFEIAGVLREIYGISDHDMAVYTKGNGEKLRLDGDPPAAAGSIEDALIDLRQACSGADRLPLFQAIQNLLEKTRLRDRLNSIPEIAGDNPDQDFDDILAIVAQRSADGITLADVAHELRVGLADGRRAEEEIRDAIQLLTSHKSKGLEWQAVILPYTFRTIESKQIPYPRWVQVEGRTEMICRDKADFAAQAQEFVTARDRQQLQRLLYVMCTRAKRTLLLLDDESLYAGQKRRAGWSAAELIGVANGVNREAWDGLSGELLPAALPAPSETLAEPVSPPPPDVSLADIQRALERGKDILRRVTPHTLAAHPSHETELARQKEQEENQFAAPSSNPGIRYGIWWHELMETIPWRQPVDEWHRAFRRAQPHSPQPERSAREWDLFCQSKLALWLAEPGRLIQVEFPFLWLAPDRTCVEGVMDLAVFTSADSLWNVIDWKTNRVGSAGGTGLVEVYRGQILAYVRVLREMLKPARVRGSLYLTQTGEWLTIE